MEYEISYMLTALITSIIGSGVRIAHESEKEKIYLTKILEFVACSLITGYICYEAALYYKEPRIVGIPSIILALSAVEITKFFRSIIETVFRDVIKKIPKIVTAVLRMFLNKYEDDSD